jgi:O-antigen/teichoic acid export membrane protein
MAPMALVALAPPAVVLAALLLLWALDLTTLLNVIAAWVLARLVVNLGTLIVLAQSGRLAAPDWPGLRALLPFVATIGLSNVIALLNYRVGLFVVERQMGLSAAGVYSIAVVVAELLWLVSGSLTQAAYSRIGNSDVSKAAATTVRVVQLSIVALLVAAPLVVLAAQQLIPWLIGAAYATSLTPLLCLLPGVLLFGAASALSAYFTNHAGTPQVPAQVAAVSLALNAALSLMLVPRLGLLGAAWGASVAYGISVCWLAWRFARHAGLPLHSLLVPGPQLWADVRRLMSA